jgi:hypothetical protein
LFSAYPCSSLFNDNSTSHHTAAYTQWKNCGKILSYLYIIRKPFYYYCKLWLWEIIKRFHLSISDVWLLMTVVLLRLKIVFCVFEWNSGWATFCTCYFKSQKSEWESERERYQLQHFEWIHKKCNISIFWVFFCYFRIKTISSLSQ